MNTAVPAIGMNNLKLSVCKSVMLRSVEPSVIAPPTAVFSNPSTVL
jgi:hypothetical protein